MRVNGGSELARVRMLQQQAFETRSQLDVAAQELTSNLKADRFAATGGNLTRLFALERSLDRNAVFTETLSLTELRLEMVQQTLGQILEPAEDLSIDLAAAVALGDRSAALLHAGAARRAFSDVVGALNTQVAGQSLFAGTATDGAALAPAAAILADLDALVAGAMTAADAAAAIDGYFSETPPGAFFTSGYIGAPDDLAPVDIGEGQRLDCAVRADREEVVALLRAHATAAVVAGGALAGDSAEQMALLGAAGSRLIAAREGLLDLRSAVGSLQEAVEQARARRTSERETLDRARTRIVATDQLEAASAYQQLQVQLEAIYTVTSRLANLRFANFMRS
jgi:flagellar hook-associated protein 3 FlgL